MNKRRRLIVALGASALAAPVPSFAQQQGKVWRIGAMGYNARKDAVLVTLGAFESVLAAEGFKLPRGAGVDAALAVYRAAATPK